MLNLRYGIRIGIRHLQYRQLSTLKNIPTQIKYYPNGNKSSETWKVNEKFHRIKFPAVTNYYENGNIKSEKWYRNGVLHRDGGAAIVYYNLNGNIKSEEYWIDGERFRIEMADILSIVGVVGIVILILGPLN